MTVATYTPSETELPALVRALARWQREGDEFQLHPGDVGWFQRFGSDATAAALRVWTDADRLVAIGLVDGPEVLRLAIDPERRLDPALAVDIARDLGDAPAVELPNGAALRGVLRERGWCDDEVWSPLHRDLAEPVETSSLRIDVIDPARAHVRAAVHRASFEGSIFTRDRWVAMALGPAYATARCLVGVDDGESVAAVTVWSAGPGRPGLIEPLGVHRDHRGRGHGRAITLAAASALRELGSSSAVVATPASNAAGVAAYESAGFVRLPQRVDLRRG